MLAVPIFLNMFFHFNKISFFFVFLELLVVHILSLRSWIMDFLPSNLYLHSLAERRAGVMEI